MAATKVPRVTLKILARHLGLTAGTVSAVLNNSRTAHIPQRTRDRIIAAAHELGYQPNPVARALRTGKMLSVRAGSDQVCNAGNALLIVGADQFDQALHAIRQAGFRVQDDVAVPEFGTDLITWITRFQFCRVIRASILPARPPDSTKDSRA